MSETEKKTDKPAKADPVNPRSELGQLVTMLDILAKRAGVDLSDECDPFVVARKGFCERITGR